MKIDIDETLAQRLRVAAEERGIDPQHYANQLLEQSIPVQSDNAAAWEAIRQFTTNMSNWGKANLPAGHEVDVSRESMYGDRGE
jgi:hypothetical protein